MAATEVQEASLPSEYKKWVLNVSMDCAGCGKKVRKVLHGIEGVHSTVIDLKQHKVTVIGNVDAETLIRILVKKTKKTAKLWPDESPVKGNKLEKGDSKANRDSDGGDKNRDLSKSEEPSSSSGAVAKETFGDAPSKDGDHDCVELKSDSGSKEKKSDGNSGNISPAPASKGVPENKSECPSPASANGGKKKKKKGQMRNVDVTTTLTPTDVAAGNGSSPSPPTSAGQTTVNERCDPSPPRQSEYQYAPPPPPSGHPQYVAPTPVLSYNMARPTGFPSASYSVPPMAQSSYSYAYDDPGAEMGPPPSYYSAYPPQSFYQHPSQPPELEFFSEENPNGCRVM